MLLQLKQERGIFQASILEAFNKLSDQQRSLQEQINKSLFPNPPRSLLINLILTLYQVPVKSRFQTRHPLI